MCGIAGVLSRAGGPTPAHRESVVRMTDFMRNRGPDADGVWSDDGVALGHRRLAILDLDPRSNQPMISTDGRYVLVFNGEIYNFRDLRRDLEGEGVRFRTTSDTEVLLELFAREGERMLPRLRGMFAFAVWDAYAQELFLARDSYGIKPLYYGLSKTSFIFASQVKALMCSGEMPRELEPAGVAGFLLWGSVPAPWTMFRDVFALPPGNFVRVRSGSAASPVCWHDIRQHWQQPGTIATPDDLQLIVRDALRESVAAHLVADVPVSAFLSGGIDSATVAALASELGAKIEGVTLAFDEFAGTAQDEAPMAAEIAAYYGLPHHVRRVTKAEFEESMPLIAAVMDQPSVDGVNTWFASKAASERGYKVVLSGVGGDELFCGYSSFRALPRAAAVGRVISAIPGARSLLAAPCGALARRLKRPKIGALPNYMGTMEGWYFLQRGLFMPEELPALVGREAALAGLARLAGCPAGINPTKARDNTSAVGLFESTQYLRNQLLPDSDWASMAHSLELRTPLVDARLLASLAPYAGSFAGGVGKLMMSRSPARALPQKVVDRPKTGFGIPMERWGLAPPSILPNRTRGPAQDAGLPWARRWARTMMESYVTVG
jgi:asparagine synthase (glutamine-hydrolysing)